MLADKLVGNLDYDTDREVHNLELLKLRFGESSMHQCEVMVRDLEESKRVNANVHERLAMQQGHSNKEGANQHFWPPLLGDDMRLHPAMSKTMDEFSEAYSVIKNPRLLVWKKQLGVVQLTLSFENVERSFSVSPLHATLIMHFSDKPEVIAPWSLPTLAEEVGLPPNLIEKKLMLWVNQGVLGKGPGKKYCLIEDQASH
ncbi:unnamed protein product, partial [Discosporangium mesarthrocarpum]